MKGSKIDNQNTNFFWISRTVNVAGWEKVQKRVLNDPPYSSAAYPVNVICCGVLLNRGSG
jgi:hypothetical protein